MIHDHFCASVAHTGVYITNSNLKQPKEGRESSVNVRVVARASRWREPRGGAGTRTCPRASAGEAVVRRGCASWEWRQTERGVTRTQGRWRGVGWWGAG